MTTFEPIKKSSGDDESIAILVKCAQISMKQFHPTLSISADDIEDNFDLPTIYDIVDIGAGIKI